MNATTAMETDGIELEKRYEPVEFQLPSIVYKFTNTTDDERLVRLSDSVPETLDPGDLGFHQDYGMDHWTIDGRTVTFEHQLDADSRYTTVIGIRREAIPDPESITQPIESLDVDPEKSEKTVAEVSESFTRSASSDSADSGPAAETTGDDPTETGLESDEAAMTETPESKEVGIVDQLVTELEEENISSEKLDYLRQELGNGETPPRSFDARLKQLQQDLADLRAYKSALEGFLDDHGSADEVIDRLDSKLDGLESEVVSLEELLAEHGDKIEEAESAIHGNEADIEELSAEVTAVTDEVNTLSSSLADVESQLPDYDIDARIAELDEKVSEIESLQSKLKSVFAGNPNDSSSD